MTDLLLLENNKLMYRKCNMIVPKHTTTLVNKSFLCKAVMDWQSVDTKLKNCDWLKTFSKNIKNNIMSKY